MKGESEANGKSGREEEKREKHRKNVDTISKTNRENIYTPYDWGVCVCVYMVDLPHLDELDSLISHSI